MNVSIVLAFSLGTVTGLAAAALLAGGQGRGGRHATGPPRRARGNRRGRHTN